MVPILTLIFVVAFSIFITKAATIALMHTGMSRERARFQSRSAFSGAGFTTTESELVVKHPVRRRIITLLILMGNAGVVTAIASLILGFTESDGSATSVRMISLLVFGIALLFLAMRWQRLDRLLEKIINRMLDRYTDIRPKDFTSILTVMEDYEIAELIVEENQWLKDSTLEELQLVEEGILVLGIIRDDSNYLGVPRGRYEIQPTDRLVLYGKAERIAAISKRKDELQGKQEHQEEKQKHREELKEQDKEAES